MTSPTRHPSSFLSARPPSPSPSLTSSPSSLSSLSPSSRARIDQKKRLAQAKLARRHAEQQSNQQQSQRLLSYLTPHNVIVLDDDSPPPPAVKVARVTVEEREERRYDPVDDWSEGDVEMSEEEKRSPVKVGKGRVREGVGSMRQGGNDHYRALKSTGIGESSFSSFPSLPLTDVTSRPPPPPPPPPPSNPFASNSNPTILPPDSSWRQKPSSTRPTTSPYFNPHPHIPHPTRPTDVYSAEERQIWDEFDRQRQRGRGATYSSGGQSMSEGKVKRSLPVGLFDSVAVRMEERADRDRKKRKKEHPLLEERRHAKRLRATTPHTTPSITSSSHRPPVPPPLPPPPPHHPAPLPKPHRKTQLLVDPRLAQAEAQRHERAAKQAADRLTLQRLKPSLDDLHSTVLSWLVPELDRVVKERLKDRFVSVPLRFRDEVEYQAVFYPLLLEECRSEMLGGLEELEGRMEERDGKGFFDPKGLLEVVSVVSYHQVNTFHHVEVERVEFGSSVKSSALFTNDDCVYLWYRPSVHDPFEANEWKTASLYTLARLERVHHQADDKQKERRKRGVHYKLQVHVPHGQEGEVSSHKLLTFLLKTGNQWGMVKVMSLITVHRQYRALESCALLSLFGWLKDPKGGKRRVGVKEFKGEEEGLIEGFNVSQKEAMATAMVAQDGITLIQGPPGTGKTKTIVGLINLLLLQLKPSSSSKPLSTPRANSPSPSARILICAPSNAAIDEIVARLLQPDALKDRSGQWMKPKVVRVGAGKRGEGKVQHDGVDVDAVSLDNLVNARMKGQGQRDDDDDDRTTEKKTESDKRDAAFYESALAQVKQQLDECHSHILVLEEKKHSTPDVVHLDTDPPPSDVDDVHQQLNAAHRQRKALLAEKKRLQVKKDEWYDRQRKSQQATYDARDALRLSVLNESQLVCTTLTGAGLELFTQSQSSFDCVIIDEAAQAIEIQTLIPLKYECQRCVLVGDDRQLSATVISTLATRYDYQQSLFSRLRKCGVQVQVIQIQYRMHPEIRAFPSRHFYDDQLVDADEVIRSDAVQRHISLLHPLSSRPLCDNWVDRRIAPYVLYNVAGVESRAGHASLHNVMEARVAVEVFRLIQKACQRSNPRFSVVDFIPRVGIITPYQQQVSTLRRHFRDLFQSDPSLTPFTASLEISTVDSFQGREKDYIIFSAVRAHQHDSQAGIGFVADANRLNVALTRAKCCLALLGSVRTLGKEGVWGELIKDAKERGVVVEVGEDVREVFTDPLHNSRWRRRLDPVMWGGKEEKAGSEDGDVQPSVERKPRRSLSSVSSLAADGERAESARSDGGGRREVIEKVDERKEAVKKPTTVPSRPLDRGSVNGRGDERKDPGMEADRPRTVISHPPPPPASVPKKKTMMLPGSSASPSSTSPSLSAARPTPPVLSVNKPVAPVPKVVKATPGPASAEVKRAPPSSSPQTKPSPSSSLSSLDLHSLMNLSGSLTGATPTSRPSPSPSTVTAPSTRSPSTSSTTVIKPLPAASVSTKTSTTNAVATPSPSTAERVVVKKPKRTLSSASSSASSSSPLPSTSSPSASRPSADNPSRPSSTTHTDQRSPPSSSPSRRSPSTTKPKAPSSQKEERPNPIDDVVDMTTGGSLTSEDDVIITSSHIHPPDLEDGEIPSSPPHPYLETVRGSSRAQLPAYTCGECKDFHQLMDRGRGDHEHGGRYQPQTFEVACNHRMRYVPPPSPPDFWELSTPPEPKLSSQ